MANASAWATAGPAGLGGLEPPLAQGLNSTQLGDITMDTNFALLLLSLAFAVLWVVYITYYNSRVVGYVLTRLINRFYFQDENFKIGSFTLNALSGKIMFRDIVYVTYDYTLRVQDGYLIFRWWRSYMPKDVSEDLSHSDTRLSIMLNGFELHFYNRCDLYHELEKTFGLEPVMKQEAEDGGGCGGAGAGAGAGERERAMNDANEKRRRAREAARSEAALARTWRDLIPVIKLDVCAGRVVFGNRLVPTTLSVSVEEAHLVYSTKPPASRLDHLMHFVKAKGDNCKVMLAPSPSYTAMVDDPPRYMGEGFVVMSSNHIEVYFYMDEPGLVPERPVLLQLANGDVVESAPPIWGVDIKCGKGTDFSYGPWADRQRDHLFKFFFPPNYKNLEVTPQPKPGDRRQMQSFDIRLSTLNEATIDILFTKSKETNAVHVNIGAGSYLEVTLPWLVLQDGYTTKITGQLLHLEATTSLQYRSLVESETLEYTVKCHYPLAWNHHQCWQLALTGCKATAHLVYTHIDFFLDLVNDWATKSRPDILHFVPYTWKISLLLKECEVLTVSNQYNWIDCSSTNQENNHVAFCGDLLDVSFDLPFVDFVPDVIPLKIWVQGEAVDMSLYLPEVNTSRLLLLSIDKNMKLVPCRLKASKWRRKCVKSQGWVDCWSVPIVALSIRYNYHPIPPLGPEPQADITTPEKEEILLSPMRIPRMRKQPQMNWNIDGNKFDRTTLAPDRVSVELEVGPSVLLAYGTIITSFMNLLENIFGEDQTFTDMAKSPNLDAFSWTSESSPRVNEKSSLNQSDVCMDDSSEASRGAFDPRRCRPLDVTVSIIIHDIQAHLVKNCSDSEPPCPVVLVERFGFEMDKSFRETKLQLLLSPSILVSSNNLSRSNPLASGALYQGHLMLSSFQLRGHGFFSDTNRSVEQDTVEYAWMLELQLGQLTGRLTPPQLFQVAASLETFLLLLCDDENELCPPNPVKQCHHGVNTTLCSESDPTLKYRCPTPNEIKYKMIRVAIDLVDVYIADSNTTMQTWLSPVRLSFCNLHGSGCSTGVTGLLPKVKLALYTQNNMQSNTHHHSNGSSSSQSRAPENDNWVGVGRVSLGPVLVEAAASLPQSPKNMHLVQQRFLKLHDEKTKRLWFLWPNEGRNAQCACVGGCAFFGSNRNGPNFFKPNASDLQEGINVAMFNVIETTPGEFGYGQSLLHAGQLVFHTPPYNSLNVCLQPAALVPSPLPAPARSPQPAPADRRSLTRRFSYTSVGKGSTNALVSSTRSDVPYARLVDAAAPLGSSKIDSDSKLNKTVLNVPQMESSVSDSRLALSCGIKDATSVASRKFLPSESDAFAVPKIPARPSVAVSESHYSLNSQPPHEELLPADVQRTLSVTSENHSEAFFSADEDMFPSRSSSLKYSFGSRHSAHRDKSSFGINDITTNEKWPNSVPKPEPAEAGDTASTLSGGAQPDSESGSVSSTSFISAISSQEDMTLVNLHMQTNKPIVDSPLLMASYMHNLTQYRCANWAACSLPSGGDAFNLPLFKRADDGTLVYVGQKYLPNFEPIGKVNVLKLISKKDGPSQNQHGPCSNVASHFNSQVKGHPFPPGWWDAQPSAAEGQEAAGAGDAEDERVGVNVRLRGDVDVTLTPLVLESTQKFIESLTPALATVHPVTVVNHLRLLCISTVKRANVLKQERYVMNWLPAMEAGARAQTAADDRCRLATVPRSNVHEEPVGARLQLAVHVPRVNVVLVQSSVVEDMISFSALDNLQDLTCVSLFGVSVEGVAAKYVSARRTREAVQLYYRPALRALAHKKTFGIIKGPRALISQGSGRKRGPDRGEPVYIETSQQQCEDTTFTLNVGKVHGQLRRIRNESSQLKDATITGIPCHHSKVSFKFAKMEQCSKGCDSNSTCCQSGSSDSGRETTLGYIMFECGLEGVAVKVSRHAQSQPPGDADADAEGEPGAGRRRDPPSQPPTPAPGTPPPAPAPDAALVPRAAPAGNTTSCAIDLKVVWFNFAAPPRTPITRKIDYTRLDWNLLSTASPAINAWLNPCNRLGIRVVALHRAVARRLTGTAAGLMAAALDLAPLHTLPKSRYGRHTAMARQLREEPSLQLCAVLVRHALQADGAALQCDLAERHLPSLSATTQGVVVLSRQWKNILYTPLLLEHNYKSRAPRPLNVTFALPDLLQDAPAAAAAGWPYGDPADADAALDESCLLLDADPDAPARGAGGGRPHSFPSTPPSGRAGAPRGSLALPPLPFARRPHPPAPAPAPAPGHDDHARTAEGADGALGSSASLYSRSSDERAPANERAREDLYQWMAKQEPVRAEPKTKKPIILPSKMNPLAAAPASTLPACSLYPLGGALMLLDAQLVFQPLLAALGVSPRQLPHEEAAGGDGERRAPALESLGSRLSLLAWVEAFRIHIAVSELPAGAGAGRDRQRARPPDPPDEPAFLCEKVSLEADLRKVADVAVEELVRRRNVLYISREQLKRHISTRLHLNLAVRFISQQVNMPLLRLLHQISNMYQNVKEAQLELRAQTGPRPRAAHASSVSDYRENLVSVSSLEKDSVFGGGGAGAGADPWQVPPSPAATPRASPPPPPATPAPAPAAPAPRPKSRPQSLAQKLRSTGKSVKGKLGYSSLNEGAHTPMFATDASNGSASAASVAGAAAGGSGPGAPPADDKLAPRCWRTMYLLLQLYANMPDADTITHRFSVSGGLPDQRRPPARDPPAAPAPPNTGIVVVGVARIHRTRLLASLSGLKLEAEMTSLQGSLQASRARQWSLTGTLARATIVLLEGAHQTVVRVWVGKSQALYSWEAGRAGAGGAALLSVGGVRVDLPQHPVALHGVMTRSSRQLSTTLQELGVTRTSSRASRGGTNNAGGAGSAAGGAAGAGEAESPLPRPRPRPPRPPPPQVDALLNPCHLQFSIAVQSLSITAALLPSLQAQYKMEGVGAGGTWGPRAQFTAELGSHSLSFVTRLPPGAPLPAAAAVSLPPVQVAAHVRDQPPPPTQVHYTTELGSHSLSFVTRLPPGAPLPAAAAVSLPPVQVAAHVRDQPPPPTQSSGSSSEDGAGGAGGAVPRGAVLRAGRYLAATADIGLFEHTLSTDLLNHLVLVQKVFMKEVNEVVQKVYGGEKPVPLWSEEEAPHQHLLFTLTIRIKRIQLTATTPSNSAVRLETGAVEFELSNRVQNVSPHDLKLFARAQVDINLSLGQLIRNAMFDEAEPEFLQYAFFNTRISMRNALQEETSGGGAEAGGGAGGGAGDAEVVLITLVRPLVYVQPVAVDRAVLVWLNYKSAYDYWSHQRATLHHEVLQATQQLIEKVQSAQLGGAASTLFVQLNVDDIGICLPLNQPPVPGARVGAGGGGGYCGEEGEGRGAVVVTLESTSVSACSSRALVSKGRFVGLCLRFASDFEASLDDWRPRADETTLNVCCVSEGTYEVCSRTTAARHEENAKWFLNVSWQMEGVDIHLDVSVGKQLSALGHTLTMLTGFEEEEQSVRAECPDESDLDDEPDDSRGSQESLVALRRRGGGGGGALPAWALDPAVDARDRSRRIEHEMSEQARIVADLRALGASHHTVELELRRLHELEAALYKDFRRDVLQKLRRQSVKASSITKGKLGLGSSRSRSLMVPSPPAPQDAPRSVHGKLGLGSSRSRSLMVPSPPAPQDAPRSVHGKLGLGSSRSRSLMVPSPPAPQDAPRSVHGKLGLGSSRSRSLMVPSPPAPQDAPRSVHGKLGLGSSRSRSLMVPSPPAPQDAPRSVHGKLGLGSSRSRSLMVPSPPAPQDAPRLVHGKLGLGSSRSRSLMVPSPPAPQDAPRSVHGKLGLGSSRSRSLMVPSPPAPQDAPRSVHGKLGLGSSRSRSLMVPSPPAPQDAPRSVHGKLGLGSSRSRSLMVPSPPAPQDATRLTPGGGAGGGGRAGEPGLGALGGVGDSGELLLLPEERLADIVETASWSSADSVTNTNGPSRSWSLRGKRGEAGAGGGARPPPVQRQASLPAHTDPPPAHHQPPRPHTLSMGEGAAGAADAGGSPGSPGAGAGGGERKAGAGGGGEPNVDLELDVKVLVNSGKCVLHTKDAPAHTHAHAHAQPPDDDNKGMWRGRVGRSASGGLAEGAGGGGSPGARRKARHHPAIDLTVFRVPGLHLKVHYDSKTLPEEASQPNPWAPGAGAGAGGGRKPATTKKAALLAWITLQSIPEETLISPHILDFLEQALEPIPLKTFHAPTPEAESEGGAGGGGGGAGGEAGGAAEATYAYASFPVDVIVHFHMQPSAFRFSCLPASRVECLLHLPSLQMVFSSKRAEDRSAWEGGGGAGVAAGGLSVTGCLADFSVYVFHPYGHHQHPHPHPHHHHQPTSKDQASWSPLSDSARKDSLSINVEFVKFHLSRSRKLQLQPDPDHSKATVRFSTIVDVGSAWFKYDMRRLGEILAFPKAWYRRTIVRRMFLGDLSVPDRHQTDTSSSNAVPVSPVMPQREKTKTEKSKEGGGGGGGGGGEGSAAWETLVLFAVNFTRLNVHMNMGNVMGNVSWQSRSLNCSGRLSIGSSGHRRMLLTVALAGSALDARGGIVGGAISLSAIHAYVYIEEEPLRSPVHVCGVRLAALELRLEYMGTPVLLARVSRLACGARDEWRPPPPRRQTAAPARPCIVLAHGRLGWQQLQVLMSRSTTPDLLKMQLKLEEFFTQQFKSSKRVLSALHPEYRAAPHPAPRADRRHADRNHLPHQKPVAGHGAAAGVAEGQHWARVLRRLPYVDGMVVGGTMELHGANVSLACFHGTSFKAKCWALFSLRDPCVSFATEAQHLAPHTHPHAHTECESPEGGGEPAVQVVQSLTASLGGGGGGAGAAGHQSQATVCRMTRAVLFPPQFKTLREWFAYAFASSEIDAIELFPSLEREGGGGGGGSNNNSVERGASAGGAGASAGGGGERGKGGGGGAAHTREVIFALPALQLHLRTTQRLPRARPHQPAPPAPAAASSASDDANDTETGDRPSGAAPVVECSFITEFEDHIFVSVDAEAFLFLHDLISSYLKEKDRVLPTASRGAWGEGAGGPGSPSAGRSDERDYRCHTWHLEPTVRLLSWAGKSIEPYGVDYILQKLGFRHARTTIPKWLQRGALDPLDLLLARLAALLPHQHQHQHHQPPH